MAIKAIDSMIRLESISLMDGNLWVRFSNNSFSFGIPGLPKNVHLTFGLNQDTSFANLHLTKEVPPQINGKPKVTLIKFRTDLFTSSNMPFTVSRLLLDCTHEINIHKLRKSNGGRLSFIPYNSNENNNYVPLRDFASIAFRENIKIEKKRRLKIGGDLSRSMQRLKESNFSNIISNQQIDFSWKVQCNERIGSLICNSNANIIFRIEGRWRTFKKPDIIITALKSLIAPSLLQEFNWKLKRSIVLLKHAQTFEDTREANGSPIFIDWINGDKL